MNLTAAEAPACMNWPVPAARIAKLPEAQRIQAWQKGRCAACGMKGGLVEDHSHETGLVRGLLCESCNRVEAGSDGPRFVAWRNGWNPATLLGVHDQYISPITGRPVLSPEAEYDLMTPDQQAATWAAMRAAVDAL
jgi:Recombination endonuclease VII